MNLTELKQSAKEALNAAEAIIKDAEARGGNLTATENENYTAKMAEFHAVSRTIKAREEQNTITRFFRDGKPLSGGPFLGGNDESVGFMAPVTVGPLSSETRSPEYSASLLSYLRSGGKAHTETLSVGADGMGGFTIPGSDRYTRQRNANGSIVRMNAAMYEGGPDGQSVATGGAAVNVPTIQQVAELALPDLGIYDSAMVIPTATAVKIPVQSAFGTAAQKAESGSTTNSFGGTDPTLQQIELDAWMAGSIHACSWELLQDVPTFQSFVVDDALKAQRILEGQYLATGTGTNQPTGIFGGTGTGSGQTYTLTGTASTDAPLLLGALFDVTASLKAFYQSNSSWIMSRATGLQIRRYQMQSNLFAPIATTDPDGTERILGRPVYFDINAPALPTTTSAGVLPILFGDFKQAFIIGVRGGSGINVKILDQPGASQGILYIMAYRRIDSKVRLAEAAQSLKIAHS